MERNTYDNPYRLELASRSLLIQTVLGDKVTDHQAQLEWADQYASRISGIIDAPEHEDIRTLAREGNYAEACQRVIELLS